MTVLKLSKSDPYTGNAGQSALDIFQGMPGTKPMSLHIGLLYLLLKGAKAADHAALGP